MPRDPYPRALFTGIIVDYGRDQPAGVLYVQCAPPIARQIGVKAVLESRPE